MFSSMLYVVCSVLLGGVVIGLVMIFCMFVWNWVSSGFVFRSWVSAFECGFLSSGVVENYFSYTYLILLVFFVLFDLEVSLLLNLPFQGVLYKNFFCYMFFLWLLCVSFSAEVGSGYVRWTY